MKRLAFFGFLIGLVFSSISTTQAQDTNTTDPLCGMTAPASCFTVVQKSNIIYETRKAHTSPNDSIPHCPAGMGNVGLGNESAFSPLFNNLDITDPDSTKKLQELQLLLISNTTWGGEMHAPIGETLSDPDSNNSLSVTCSLEYFSDGKYGICSEEAVRRYLEWYKAENCNTKPTLTITAPQEATQGEEVIAQITSAGGTVYKLNEELFTAEEVDPIEIENIVLKSSNTNVHTTFPEATLNTDIPLTFSSTGTTTLSATGTVVGKPNLEVTSNDAKITIKSSPKPLQPSANELGCNQLLPKYLVGASCDTELKGDASDITYWLQKFSGQITTFVAAIAVLLIAWNAFGLVMAAGDSDQLANGKKALMWVGIGLLLTVFAYVIVKTALSLTFLQ